MAILRGRPEPTQWRGYLASLDWSTSRTLLVVCQRQVRLSQGGYWAQIPRETPACAPGRTFLWEPSLLLCGHHIAARPGSRVGWGIMNECLKGNRHQNSFYSNHRGHASRTCGFSRDSGGFCLLLQQHDMTSKNHETVCVSSNHQAAHEKLSLFWKKHRKLKVETVKGNSLK